MPRNNIDFSKLSIAQLDTYAREIIKKANGIQDKVEFHQSKVKFLQAHVWELLAESQRAIDEIERREKGKLP